jgi:hypothetical protein
MKQASLILLIQTINNKYKRNRLTKLKIVLYSNCKREREKLTKGGKVYQTTTQKLKEIKAKVAREYNKKRKADNKVFQRFSGIEKLTIKAEVER